MLSLKEQLARDIMFLHQGWNEDLVTMHEIQQSIERLSTEQVYQWLTEHGCVWDENLEEWKGPEWEEVQGE